MDARSDDESNKEEKVKLETEPAPSQHVLELRQEMAQLEQIFRGSCRTVSPAMEMNEFRPPSRPTSSNAANSPAAHSYATSTAAHTLYPSPNMGGVGAVKSPHAIDEFQPSSRPTSSNATNSTAAHSYATSPAAHTLYPSSNMVDDFRPPSRPTSSNATNSPAAHSYSTPPAAHTYPLPVMGDEFRPPRPTSSNATNSPAAHRYDTPPAAHSFYPSPNMAAGVNAKSPPSRPTSSNATNSPAAHSYSTPPAAHTLYPSPVMGGDEFRPPRPTSSNATYSSATHSHATPPTAHTLYPSPVVASKSPDVHPYMMHILPPPPVPPVIPYNQPTQTTPTAPTPEVALWKRMQGSNGMHYYYNVGTGTCQYETPPGMPHQPMNQGDRPSPHAFRREHEYYQTPPGMPSQHHGDGPSPHASYRGPHGMPSQHHGDGPPYAYSTQAPRPYTPPIQPPPYRQYPVAYTPPGVPYGMRVPRLLDLPSPLNEIYINEQAGSPAKKKKLRAEGGMDGKEGVEKKEPSKYAETAERLNIPLEVLESRMINMENIPFDSFLRTFGSFNRYDREEYDKQVQFDRDHRAQMSIARSLALDVEFHTIESARHAAEAAAHADAIKQMEKAHGRPLDY